jgi:ornithine cyclodeaminase
MVIRHLTQQAPLRLVVIGTGPQAYGHVEAIASVRPIAHLTIGGRNRSQTERFAVWAAGQGLPTMVVAGSELPDDLQGPIHEADVVVCATSSAHPVFSSAWLTTPSIVIAMGSQNPQHREVDSNLVAGGTVIVESRAAALEASGDILIPMAERRGGPDLINADLVELIHGWVNIPLDRPVLFSGVGEAWQDLVLASAVFDALVETAAHQGQ